MSYHKFPNLRELFSGNLTGKMMRDIDSLDFIDRECNCNKASLVGGECIFWGDCQKSMVVYKCECICGKFYIGNTQNHIKKRIQGHLVETRSLINKEASSDTFN